MFAIEWTTGAHIIIRNICTETFHKAEVSRGASRYDLETRTVQESASQVRTSSANTQLRKLDSYRARGTAPSIHKDPSAFRDLCRRKWQFEMFVEPQRNRQKAARQRNRLREAHIGWNPRGDVSSSLNMLCKSSILGICHIHYPRYQLVKHASLKHSFP